MPAEAFEQEFRSYYLSEKLEPDFSHKLDLPGLYGRFIKRKFDIYYEEKYRISADSVYKYVILENRVKYLQDMHELLALRELFTEKQLKSLKINYQSTPSIEDLARIGIVQEDHEGKPQFINRTLAEYFVALFLIKQLRNENKQNTQVQDILLNKVLLKRYYHVIIAFLDRLLKAYKPTEKVLKDYGQKLDKRWNERKERGPLTGETTALFQAATEDNANIIGFIEDSLKSAGCVITVTEMMLAKDDKGRNVMHAAGKNGSLKAIDKICVWVEEVVIIRRNI